MAKKENKESLDPMVLALTHGIKDFSGVCGFGAFIPKRPLISTGSLNLDLKLGGGVASDRVVEFYGPPQSMKTSWALSTMKCYVDQFGYDRIPFILDIERTILADFVASFGLDPNRIFVARPATAEQAMQIISNMMASGKFGIGILDSIDALESAEDVGKNYGEASMMKLPKLMSEAMRDLSKASVDNNTGLILINQCRTGMSAYQAVETTSGGKAIPYYTSQRIRFSNKGPSENVTGAVTIKAALKKNKLFPLIQSEAEIDFIPGKGVDKTSDYLSVSKELGITTLSGPYYSVWNGEELLGKFQGRVKFGEWVTSSKENTTMFEELVKNKFDQVYHGMVTEPSEEEENSIEV